jgi:hypothetical protein
MQKGNPITGLPFTLSTEFGGVGPHYLVAFFSGSTLLGGVPLLDAPSSDINRVLSLTHNNALFLFVYCECLENLGLF